MILALAGGVGGARLAQGLVRCLGPGELMIAVNVGDDFEHLGLHVSPDLDTVMYTLAGLHDPAAGWGRADETWHFMETLGRLGGDTWFQLGDRDLAVHVERTRRLNGGEPLSSITADFCTALGLAHTVVPVTDARLRTWVGTPDGELAFQDYFVRQRCAPVATGFRFEGAAAARPSPPLARLLSSGYLRGVVICPSNPWLSVAPMLAVSELGALLATHAVPVIAVSPIVGGAAIKGPAAKIMRELGSPVDVAGVVAHYGPRVGGWVIDQQDASRADAIAALGHRVTVTDTLMSSGQRAQALAATVLDLLATMATRQ